VTRALLASPGMTVALLGWRPLPGCRISPAHVMTPQPRLWLGRGPDWAARASARTLESGRY